MNVAYLQSIVFSQLSLSEKLNIKNAGRSVPDLNIVQTSLSRNNQYQRKFHSQIYSKYDWLCGCNAKNALFCFPCLLYGGDSAWTIQGIKDLHHLPGKIKKHENSEKHLKNVIDLAMLGKVNIASQISDGYRLNIIKHNEEVQKNREILSKIIDCIKFCGKFELPLRGHIECFGSGNPGVYRGLLEFAGKLDGALKAHFESATVFKGNSKTIQNELLDCILVVCRNQIINEISDSKFLAIMADDTTDISEKVQEVLVFRYVYGGKAYERFWGFCNPQSQDAEGLSKYILEQLNVVIKDNFEKLIAQTYDGTNVMSGYKNGLQAKIKEKYPNAHFIHCYAHQLNLIMEKAASHSSDVRIFFSGLNAITTFFSRSPQRLSVLDMKCQRVPRAPATRWNFKSRVVNTVYEHLDELKECFQELQNSKNVPTVQSASGLLRMLKDTNFLFWLEFFHIIMPHVDVLYNQLQCRNANSSFLQSAINNFSKAISKIREKVNPSQMSTPETKRRKLNKDLTVIAKETCDIICFQASERFKFTGHLSAAKLIASDQFQTFSQNFPLKEFLETTFSYPMLDKAKLRTELSVLYEREEFTNVSGALKLYEIILSSGLQNSLSELYSLLEIILTTPMTTSEPERCFSTLKRIKTFLRSTMSEDRLSALAMLSISNSLIDNVENFNEKVIDEFCQRKDRRMSFVYK